MGGIHSTLKKGKQISNSVSNPNRHMRLIDRQGFFLTNFTANIYGMNERTKRIKKVGPSTGSLRVRGRTRRQAQ